MNKEDTPFIINIIQDLAGVHSLVNKHFKDEKKTVEWLNSSSPLLEGLAPNELIFEGRTDELLTHIKTQLRENEP